MTEVKRFYWDSCCWLGLINQEPEKLTGLEYVYNTAKLGKFEIWTSALSFAEVYRLRSEDGLSKPLSDNGLDIIDEVFRQDFIQIVTVDMEIGHEARRLLRAHPGLTKRMDAIHLASALRWSVDAMHTYDKADLLHLDGKLRCRSGEFLEICVPEVPASGPLFAQNQPS